MRQTTTHQGGCPVRLMQITTVPITLGFLMGQPAYMRARGIETHAVSSPGERLYAFGASNRVQVTAIAMHRRITLLEDLRAVWHLVRTLRRVRPHIVHAHTPKGGLLGMIAASLARVPVRIYHLHGLPYMTATGWRRRLLKATERISCRLAHRVLCVSESLRAVAIADGLCSHDKIVVPGAGSINGVDANGRFNPAHVPGDERLSLREELGIPANAVVLGFVGRIVRDKGIHELAEAWRELRLRFPGAHLVLVGPIEPEDPVDTDVLGWLRGDSRVHLTGIVSDIGSYYGIFDLLVLPTWREGFGNVLIEAAAMGLPVISTRIPGCVDAVEDGVTGTLVPVGDVTALGDAMTNYLYDASLRARHGAAGRARVLEMFRQEVIWDALHQEYIRLAREHGVTIPDARAGGA